MISAISSIDVSCRKLNILSANISSMALAKLRPNRNERKLRQENAACRLARHSCEGAQDPRCNRGKNLVHAPFLVEFTESVQRCGGPEPVNWGPKAWCY